ncbi:MAG TPA: hypothetical protein VJC05_00090 [Candidatus Andersenbacteria bacterium]|nr:hypothetical protein [Candidatus Andersenbacteria bacterium]
MTRHRLIALVVVSFTLAILALMTDAFWWFLEINWQVAWSDFKVGVGESEIACLWAVVHGVWSVIPAALLSFCKKPPFESAREYFAGYLALLIGSTILFGLSDLTSGWWLLNGGIYFATARCAFLQSFLVSNLLVLLFLPVPVQEYRQLKLGF